MNDDVRYMRRAIALARRGLGYVEPNPPVGCLIVRDGSVVGEGWHRQFGRPHAEIEALNAAGGAARQATAYVTLEPCAHWGKTPPCVRALIEAGLDRVVIGSTDPNPQATGGISQLREAGITVDVGIESTKTDNLIRAFAKRVRTGLPWVIAKWAATVDGAIATHTGDSQWISNDASRKQVHRLRARCDAIIVGIGTALADDPQLTARNVRVRRKARRVVVDPQLKLPLESRLVRTLDQAPLTIATSIEHAQPGDRADAFRQLGVEVVGLPQATEPTRHLDLRALLSHLAKVHNATWIMTEGGAGLHGAMLGQGLIDELWVFTAPKLLGGGGLPPAVGDSAGNISQMQNALPLRLSGVRRLKGDVWLTFRLDLPGSEC